MLIIDKEGIDPLTPEFDSRRDSRWSTADDHDSYVINVFLYESFEFIILREKRESVETLNPHTRRDLGHTCLHRFVVRENKALRTLTVGAENSLRTPVLWMMPENMNPVGKQCGGDNFTLIRIEWLPVKRERDFPSSGNIKYRMALNSVMIGHNNLS
jgi:hypothetical protein